MNANDLARTVSFLIVIPVVLTAQGAQENVVPLKNWLLPSTGWKHGLEGKPIPQCPVEESSLIRLALQFGQCT